MQKKYRLLIIFYFILIGGCGTVQTNFNNEAAVKNQLRRYKSNCTELSRVYSGVLFDLCLLNSATPNAMQQLFLGFYIIDVIPSAVADSIVLPYSIYAQSEYGVIKIR